MGASEGALPTPADSGDPSHSGPAGNAGEAQRRLDLLVNAAGALAASTTYAETLNVLARLAVDPRADLADMAVIDMLSADGTIVRACLAHRDPAVEPLLRETLADFAVDPASEHPVAVVLRTGQTDVTSDVSPERLRVILGRDEWVHGAIAIGVSSQITVPLTANRRVIGALSIVAMGSGRQYADVDVAVAEDLGRVSALALDKARLLAEQAETVTVLDAVLRNAPVGLAFFDPQLRFVRVTDALAARTGRRPEDLLGRRVDAAVGSMGLDIAAEIQWVFASGKPVVEREFTGLASSSVGVEPGERRVWISSFYPVPGPDGEVAFVGAVVVDVTRRRQAEAEREYLLAAEHQARTEAEQAHRRLEFMLEVSTVLSSTLDHELAMRRLARLAVPVLADVCFIDTLEESGEIRRMAAVNADPAQRSLMRQLENRPPAIDGPHPIAEVMRTGRSLVGPEIGKLFLRSTSLDEAHFEVVSRLGFESYMCLPLMAGARVVGTLTLVAAGSGRSFGARDLAEAEEFARRAGTAIERARLYQREHHVAETLQRSLLPERLPTVTGLRMTGRYIAGSEGMDIGGDWYDVVNLPDGTVMVVVGDVMGRGVRAASLMGQLRDAVRVYTTEGLGPAAIATRVNAFVEMFVGDMATFVCAVIDPLRRTMRYTRAGHPPPLVVAGRDASGGRNVRFADAAGSVPVGLFPDAVYEEAIVALESGTTIVLYTDGLVERRDADMDEGFARLVDVATAAHHDDPDELADSILDTMLGAGPRRDDVALLIVRVTA